MKSATMLLTAVLLLPASLALAQSAAPPAPLKTFMSAADIDGLIAEIKAMPPKQNITRPIVGAGPYRAVLEYRTGAPAPANIHETETELMVIVAGTGTITVGGTLVNARRTGPNGQSGDSITGGTPHHVGKGDTLIFAAGTPHQIAPDPGVSLGFMTYHAPGTWPGKP